MIKSIQVNRYHVCKKLPMVSTIIRKKHLTQTSCILCPTK